MKTKSTFHCALFGVVALVSAAAIAQAPKAVSVGTYECWAWGSPRLLMNFKVTSTKNYSNHDGDKKGSFAYAPTTGLITFKGGHLDGVLPTEFTAVYHEKNNKPTVSFRGRSGSEAQFCERVGK